MLRTTLLEALYGVWPMIVIFTVVLASFRITYILYRREKFVLYKELYSLMFLIYILVLFYVVTFQDNNYADSNLVPFREIFRYNVGSGLFYTNVVGNVLLFLPFGFFVSSYLRNRNVYPVLVLSIISSLSIELTQSAIGRTFDIDDIILNVFGGIIGYLLWKFVYSMRKKLPKPLRKDWFANLITITIIFILIFYIIEVHTYLIGLVT